MKIEIIRREPLEENSLEKNLSDMEKGIKNSDSNDSALANISIKTKEPSVIINRDQKEDYNWEAVRNNSSIVEEKVSSKISVTPRMRRTSFQARLGKRMDRISQKLIDNQIRLTSNPTDMLRIKVTRDPRSQDLISRTVESAEIVPIILPPMADIPMRKLLREEGDDTLIPSLYPTSETTYYELYSPLEIKLDEDDLLLRIIEDPQAQEPYVMCLQIKEILGTLGYSSFRYQKFWATLYDERLPKEIIQILKKTHNRRKEMGW